MLTTIRYFASVREAIGAASEDVEIPPDVLTLGAARQWLCTLSARHGEALAASKPLRMACDHVMCGDDDPLIPGREIAVFPPVTGG